MIVTIDGPAASGKGTLARRLGEALGVPALDTGLLYRSVADLMLRAGQRLDDAEAAERVARALDASHLSDAERLTGRGAGEAASRVAGYPGVRAALLAFQKAFARQPGGAVLDGRDTGTVIAPEADFKIFVTASPEVRAVRRFRELAGQGQAITYEQVLSDIRRRDERDAERAAAPLKPAPDAVLLDTTELDIEAAFREVLKIVRRA